MKSTWMRMRRGLFFFFFFFSYGGTCGVRPSFISLLLLLTACLLRRRRRRRRRLLSSLILGVVVVAFGHGSSPLLMNQSPPGPGPEDTADLIPKERRRRHEDGELTEKDFSHYCNLNGIGSFD